MGRVLLSRTERVLRQIAIAVYFVAVVSDHYLGFLTEVELSGNRG